MDAGAGYHIWNNIILQADKKRKCYLPEFPYASLSSVSIATATSLTFALPMKIYSA